MSREHVPETLAESESSAIEAARATGTVQLYQIWERIGQLTALAKQNEANQNRHESWHTTEASGALVQRQQEWTEEQENRRAVQGAIHTAIETFQQHVVRCDDRAEHAQELARETRKWVIGLVIGGGLTILGGVLKEVLPALIHGGGG